MIFLIMFISCASWYEGLTNFLLDNNFRRCKVDDTLFIKGEHFLTIQIYVVDIIFHSTNLEVCEEFSLLMRNEFEMSMMGELNFFLDLQIKQTSNDDMIHQ